MSTDPTHTSTHIIASACQCLPSHQGRRTMGTLWSQCQKSSVGRSHFQVTRLNTTNPLFVFSAAMQLFCFLLSPERSHTNNFKLCCVFRPTFPPLRKDCCPVVKSFVVSLIPGAVFEFHVIVCALIDLGRVSPLMALCVFSL